jgi:hypothetical protein
MTKRSARFVLIPCLVLVAHVGSLGLPTAARAYHVAPTGLTVTGTTPNSVSLDWNDYTAFAIRGYRVSRYTRSGTLIDRRIIGTTSAYTWTALQPSTTYLFAVQAVSPGGHLSQASARVSATTAAASLSCPAGEYRAQYWPNVDLTGTPALIRCESAVNNDWAGGGPPGLPVDKFSARYDATINLQAGDYEFRVTSDDGVRLWVDGTLVIDKWIDQPARTYTASKHMTAGTHTVRVEFYENGGLAVLKLGIAKVAEPTAPPPAPSGLPLKQRVCWNTHMNFGGPYADTALIKSMLDYVGTDCIRDGLPSDHQATGMPNDWNQLGRQVIAYCVERYGSKEVAWDWDTYDTTGKGPRDCVRTFVNNTQREVMVTGTNEPSCHNQAELDANLGLLTDHMNAIKAETAAQGLDAATVSLCNGDRWNAPLLTGLVNDIHPYHSAGFPEVGPASIGHSLEWWMANERVSTSDRWVSTETGINITSGGGYAADQTEQARWDLVVALTNLYKGVERVAIYQIADDITTSQWGAYTYSGARRLVADVFHNWMLVMGEARTGPLSGVNHSVSDAAGTALSLPMRDGTKQYVALWNRASTATRNVTLNLSEARAIGIIRPMASTSAESRSSSTSHAISLGNDPVVVAIP